jgi:hypothetical protein
MDQWPGGGKGRGEGGDGDRGRLMEGEGVNGKWPPIHNLKCESMEKYSSQSQKIII